MQRPHITEQHTATGFAWAAAQYRMQGGRWGGAGQDGGWGGGVRGVPVEAAGTPGESGRPRVATPEPACTRKESACP